MTLITHLRRNNPAIVKYIQTNNLKKSNTPIAMPGMFTPEEATGRSILSRDSTVSVANELSETIGILTAGRIIGKSRISISRILFLK